MNRQQKECEVQDLQQLFNSSAASFLVQYKGLTVAQIDALRSSLREVQGKFRVSKARLMKIALRDRATADSFAAHAKDQVAVIFALGEAPAVAKKIVEFAKKNNSLAVVSGFFEEKAISREQVSFLANVPSREVLLAQLCGVLQAPVVNVARVLQAPVVQFLHALKAVAEKKESNK